jgi:mRNA-degrading endonuclease RelE of RelBE toxin-antitoxin system
MTIDQNQLEQAREKLKDLQPNTRDLTLKATIENLRPEIEAKIKAGLSYKDIGAAIYDGLGLSEGERKKEIFWRSVVRFHKPFGKKAAKLSRKPARPKPEAPPCQAQENERQ